MKAGPKGKGGPTYNLRKAFDPKVKAQLKKAEAKAKRLGKLENVRTEAQKKILDDKIQSVESQILKLRDRLSALRAEAGYDDSEEPREGYSMSAMLEQMWKVYRTAGGLKKLKEVMKDPKEFRAMAREMLKVEATVARARKDDPLQGQAVYVVLTGLQADQARVGTQEFDLQKLMASLDPNAGPRIAETTDARTAPTQIMKPVDSVEG